MVFLHSDVIVELGDDLVIYYYQDTSNNTHVAECQHLRVSAEMNCAVRRSYNHTTRIRSFASTYFTDTEGFNYFYSIVFEVESKVVHIYDFGRQQLIAEITYTGSYEAEVTSVASSSNGLLYVLRRFAKAIDVYSLAKCAEYSTCTP